MSDDRILVIDDELAMRQALATVLKSEGYEVFLAENGKEGLSLVEEVSPGVIILDMRMPVMNGLEFLAQLKPQPSDPYSVIVMSGHDDDAAVKASYETCITSFLWKPMNVYELAGAVKNAIAWKSAMRSCSKPMTI